MPDEDAPSVPGAIREGKAEVLPNQDAKRADGKAEVFYNPAQVFNRDLSIVVLSVFARIRSAELAERRRKKEQRAQDKGKELAPAREGGLKILEALAATGIRSIRYHKELGDSIRCIVANDLDSTAVAHMRRNLAHNHVPEGRVQATCEDANSHMYARRARGPGGIGDDAYDVIDLDPYGTCSPFLDAAVQAVGDGGLLCITSTDMPVLGGNYPETCFYRYGGTALKASYVHEMALRLVVHAVSTAAAKYGREVQPLMSCSIDFYVRVFVRVHDSPARVKHQATKTGVVHQCVQCESFFVQPFGEVETVKAAREASAIWQSTLRGLILVQENNFKFKPARVTAPGTDCPECGGKLKLGGPFYLGKLHDADFVQQVLEATEEDEQHSLPGVTSWKKVRSLAVTISEEHADLPLHYRVPQLCKSIKLPPMPVKTMRGTLHSLGYRASHFHREPEAVKTDAPNAVVFDLLRLWAEEHPPRSNPLPAILKKELTVKRPIEWTAEVHEDRKKAPRFLPNPEKNWGPKPRARGGGAGAATPEPSSAVDSEAVPSSAAGATAEAPRTLAENQADAVATGSAAATAEAPAAAAPSPATVEGNAVEATPAKRQRTDNGAED